jgi:adenylate cyclase
MNESARQAQGRVRLQRVLFSVFPGNPRCFTCNAPLSGSGATLIGLTGIRSSSFNPQLCNQCESIARDHEGGAEVKLTMLFADVRGSTPLSISNSPTQYSKRNALVNRLVGDQVIGLFVPRLAGADHAYQAIETGRDILQAAESEKSGVPVVPFGIGIHTGIAYVGSIGASEGVNEIAVLGDSANIAARLSSAAGPGELIVSEAAALEAELNDDEWDTRQLNLKGVHGAINVRVAQIISEVASDL